MGYLMTYSIEQAHLATAKAYAKRSKSVKLKVGAVIVQDDRPVSVGYNGTPPGSDNTCEDLIDGEWVTRPEVIHAESNCIGYAARRGVATEGATIVITHRPCFRCSKLILSAGITKVLYDRDYGDTTGVDILVKNNIEVGVIHEEN